jgi:hypothetical protein
LDGTRQHVLQKIEAWINEPAYDAKRILWLTAPAGTGKSAVAASVEAHLRETHQLGAVFYFVREQPQRNKRVVLEIARQLALRNALLRESICAAVKTDIDISTKLPRHQYQLLIQNSLRAVPADSPRLVVILDAVDEHDEEGAITLLRLVTTGVKELAPTIKIFISSRLETYLKATLNDRGIVEHYPLEEEEAGSVARDIELYLQKRLPLAVQRFGIQDTDWPGPMRRADLVRMASGLFIWISTVVALIAKPPSGIPPEAQLTRILTSPVTTTLDSLYHDILDRAFPQGTDSDVLNLLTTVLGTLIVAQESLSVATLTSFVASHSRQTVAESDVRWQILEKLQAVLTVPEHDGGAIRFMHQSSVDFLTSPQCDPRFRLRPVDHHQHLALACFRCVNDLKFNICGLDRSRLNAEVDDLEARVSACLSPSLQYACKYWAAHLEQVSTDTEVLHNALGDFVNTRLLFWLETMSILGRVRESVYMAQKTERWLMVC